MKNGALFATCLLFAFSFLPHGHSAEITQIQTRVVQSDKNTPFSEKAFSFLLEKQKPQKQNPSYVAGVLLPNQVAKVKNLGTRLPDVALKSGQKGTVLYTWNVKATAASCAKAKDAKSCASTDWAGRAGLACTYVPSIHGNQVHLKLRFIDKQFVGLLDPAAVAKISGKPNKKITTECAQKSCKPIAVFTVKEVNATVQLQDAQTLVVYLSRTKSGQRKYLLVTVHTLRS